MYVRSATNNKQTTEEREETPPPLWIVVYRLQNVVVLTRWAASNATAICFSVEGREERERKERKKEL